MRKIMFNDKFGLTQAVLDGRKTMTRRIIPQNVLDKVEEYQLLYYNAALDSISFEDALYNMANEGFIRSAYKVGEVVAIAQPYKDLVDNLYFLNQLDANGDWVDIMKEKAGWNNKMFVSSYYLPNKIRITSIKVEQLQDISDEDCIKEGVYTVMASRMFYSAKGIVDDSGYEILWCNPKQAFTSLIDKVSGKGTWDSNPYVFAYSFELLR